MMPPGLMWRSPEILRRRDKHDVTTGEADDECLDRVKELFRVTEEEVVFQNFEFECFVPPNQR